MTIIESKKVALPKAPSEVSEFVQDLNNFELLLPTERISNFVSDGSTCSFKINGMATIGLKVVEVLPELIKLESTDSPFSFTIDIFLNKTGDGTEAHQVVNLDLNPMMKLMVEKPLRNLFDHIAERLQKVLS